MKSAHLSRAPGRVIRLTTWKAEVNHNKEIAFVDSKPSIHYTCAKP